jgi:hypothetical protein
MYACKQHVTVLVVVTSQGRCFVLKKVSTVHSDQRSCVCSCADGCSSGFEIVKGVCRPPGALSCGQQGEACCPTGRLFSGQELSTDFEDLGPPCTEPNLTCDDITAQSPTSKCVACGRDGERPCAGEGAIVPSQLCWPLVFFLSYVFATCGVSQRRRNSSIRVTDVQGSQVFKM